MSTIIQQEARYTESACQERLTEMQATGQTMLADHGLIQIMTRCKQTDELGA